VTLGIAPERVLVFAAEGGALRQAAE